MDKMTSMDFRRLKDSLGSTFEYYFYSHDPIALKVMLDASETEIVEYMAFVDNFEPWFRQTIQSTLATLEKLHWIPALYALGVKFSMDKLVKSAVARESLVPAAQLCFSEMLDFRLAELCSAEVISMDTHRRALDSKEVERFDYILNHSFSNALSIPNSEVRHRAFETDMRWLYSFNHRVCTYFQMCRKLCMAERQIKDDVAVEMFESVICSVANGEGEESVLEHFSMFSGVDVTDIIDITLT